MAWGYGEPCPKPERRSRLKKRKERKQRLSRAQCRAIVFANAKNRCERCGRQVTDDTEPWRDERAHVNETVPRSKDRNAPYKPECCELLCRRCHLPNGRHAPTKERMEQILRSRR